MLTLTEKTTHPALIEGYAADGAGVARVDGMVVFVKNAVRGETCDIFIEKVGRSAAWGRVERVTAPSPSRKEPTCPHFGLCGGCQFRHVTYAEELEAKRLRVEDALRRVGGANISVDVIHGAQATTRYRNKIQFPLAPTPDGTPAIGFFQARSHKVVPVADCLLQPQSTGALRAALARWMTDHRVPAYDEATHTGLVRHLYVRVNSAGQSLCCLVVNGNSLPDEPSLVEALRQADPNLAGIVLNRNEKNTNVILGDRYRTLWGADYLEDTLCGLTFRLSVPSFFQVNRAQTEVLYRLAADFAELTGTETLLDLYCGIGTISLVMAQSARRVIGAEVVPQAVSDAKANARRNGVANAEFYCADAALIAQTFAAQGLRPDVVTVDPPRKGLAPQVVDAIRAMSPRRVVYVSCDPATLARDVKLFSAGGYALRRAEAVDLFPRTAHVETVALLDRI